MSPYRGLAEQIVDASTKMPPLAGLSKNEPAPPVVRSLNSLSHRKPVVARVMRQQGAGIMKKFAYTIVAVVLVALGWSVRGRADSMDAAAKTNQSTVSTDVLKAQIFNTAYAEVTFSEVIIEQLASGRVDDAKEMLRTHQDGHIFSLENSLDSAAISPDEMVALQDLNLSLESSHGSRREVAERSLARIARFRADHPWTYSGTLPHSTDPEVEAKLASILKRASDSQR